MPRKQRFKPSRKPKPVPALTPETPHENIEVGSSSVSTDGGVRSSGEDRAEAALEEMIPPHLEPASQAEAR